MGSPVSALKGGGAGIKDDFAVAGSDDMGIGLNVEGQGGGARVPRLAPSSPGQATREQGVRSIGQG